MSTGQVSAFNVYDPFGMGNGAWNTSIVNGSVNYQPDMMQSYAANGSQSYDSFGYAPFGGNSGYGYRAPYPSYYPSYQYAYPPGPNYGTQGSWNTDLMNSNNGYSVFNLNLNFLKDNLIKLFGKVKPAEPDDDDDNTGGGDNNGSGDIDFKTRIKDGEKFTIQFNQADDGVLTANDKLGSIDGRKAYVLTYNGDGYTTKGYSELTQTVKTIRTRGGDPDNGEIHVWNYKFTVEEQTDGTLAVKKGGTTVGTLTFASDV
jgi:hypothetical protein